MLVFVYGTLKKGKRLHGWMEDIEFISEGFTAEVNLYLPNELFPYPFCKRSDGQCDGVYGEVYTCDEHQLAMLDRVEGYPSLYTRERIRVTLLDGKVVTCYVYVPAIELDVSKHEQCIKF